MKAYLNLSLRNLDNLTKYFLIRPVVEIKLYRLMMKKMQMSDLCRLV